MPDDRKPARPVRGKKAASSRRYALIGAIVAVVVFAAVGLVLANGSGGSASSGRSVVDDASDAVTATASQGTADDAAATSQEGEDYGTTPANIANGGYVAYANGKTYYVGNSSKDTSGSSYRRTAIASYEGSISSRQILYKAGKQKYKTSSGNATSQKTISCLHVTGDALVFCEEYWTSEDTHIYDIVETDLDGTGRQVIVSGNDIKSCPSSLSLLAVYLWIDNGNLYYVDNENLWSQPLSGGDRKQVIELVSGEAYAVSNGTVYYSKDSGFEVDALDVATGTTSTVYRGDSIKGVSSAESTLEKLTSDAPSVKSILPEGDRLYLGAAEAIGSTLDGYISIKTDGTDGIFYSGAYDTDTYAGILGFTVHDGLVYFIYGKESVGTGGLAIVACDPSAGEGDRFTSLYTTDGTGTDSDGATGRWLGIADGRIFFQSKGYTGIRGIGSSQTTEEKYDRGTPWSMDLDGSNLTRGIG